MTGLVSVVIPVRNGERYLAEAIRSVLNQTYAPLEVIVVNNGSTDGSRAVAEKFGEPVRVIEQPIPGVPRTRNVGADAARGSFLAFLDADDLWETPKLARQLEFLAGAPDVDLVFTNVQEFVSPELTESEKARLIARPDAIEGWYASTLLARMQSFRSLGPMPDLPFGEFIAWFGLAREAGLRSRLISEVLAKRRVHLANMSRRSRRDMMGYVKAAKMVLDSRRGSSASQDA